MKRTGTLYVTLLLACGLCFVFLGGQSKDCVDNDGDGYYVSTCGSECEPLDCDDTNADVNPGAEESFFTGACTDGLDNDCNGLVDGDDAGCQECPLTLGDMDCIYGIQRQARTDELFCMMSTPNCDQDFVACYQGCSIEDESDLICLGFTIDDENAEIILGLCGVAECLSISPGQCQDACLETCADLPCIEICWVACTDNFFDCVFAEW